MDSKSVALSEPDVVGFRQSSVVTLAAHGVLAADQVAAAFHFRNAFEHLVEAKRESIGFNEWQSPGPLPAHVAERRSLASQDLRKARGLLGAHGYALVGKVCGEGYHIADLFSSRRERDTMTDMLRLHLTSLAKLWRL
jgi:hypothetical protein